jgi:GTP-binding protein HflX
MSTTKTKVEIPTALLVAVQTPDLSDFDVQESLDELERLVTTLGFRVVGRETQKQNTTRGATAVGTGKLRQIAHLVGEAGNPEETPELPDGGLIAGAAGLEEYASVVVFDCDLKPSQMRHIESALQVEVLDRTGVIIEIFSRHAKTRAARLQVEIARLNYLSPRLREVGSSGERQSGRGAGESALELGRREIRDRLAVLRRELEILQRDEGRSRANRSDQPSVALVGYTNAGKSSTMRALTGSSVLVEDKLFATLDTTVRALMPEGPFRVLISDTVGFIKKLPHDLVASFRSTLEEAVHSSLLLYVADASDPGFRAQLETVEAVLSETGARGRPHLLVLNKADLLQPLQRKRLEREFPNAVITSSQVPSDVAALRERILGFFEKDLVDGAVFAPYDRPDILREIRARGSRVLSETHEETGTRFIVRASAERLAELQGM